MLYFKVNDPDPLCQANATEINVPLLIKIQELVFNDRTIKLYVVKIVYRTQIYLKLSIVPLSFHHVTVGVDSLFHFLGVRKHGLNL